MASIIPRSLQPRPRGPLLKLTDEPNPSCKAADTIARAQLSQVQCRIEQLQALKTELERMIEQYRHGKIGDCRVIARAGPRSRVEEAIIKMIDIG